MSRKSITFLILILASFIYSCEEEKEEFPHAEDRGGGCAMCKFEEDEN
jgi:hypothetical protein